MLLSTDLPQHPHLMVDGEDSTQCPNKELGQAREGKSWAEKGLMITQFHPEAPAPQNKNINKTTIAYHNINQYNGYIQSEQEKEKQDVRINNGTLF